MLILEALFIVMLFDMGV